MLATRQVLGSVARSRVAMASQGLRRMATVTDSPLDRKVSPIAVPTFLLSVPRSGLPVGALAL